MKTPERPALSPAENALADIFADAVVADLMAEGGVWVAVACRDEADREELVARLRREGREVRVHAA